MRDHYFQCVDHRQPAAVWSKSIIVDVVGCQSIDTSNSRSRMAGLRFKSGDQSPGGQNSCPACQRNLALYGVASAKDLVELSETCYVQAGQEFCHPPS